MGMIIDDGVPKVVNNAVVHPTARIYPFCNLFGCEIGEGTVVGALTEIGRDVRIGKNCRIEAGVYIPEGVVIEDNVFIGPHVVFTNDKYPPSHGEWRNGLKTIVEDGASVGANSVILPGIRIGKEALIGAGSVVTHTIPQKAIAYGNPAKVHKYKLEGDK